MGRISLILTGYAESPNLQIAPQHDELVASPLLDEAVPQEEADSRVVQGDVVAQRRDAAPAGRVAEEPEARAAVAAPTEARVHEHVRDEALVLRVPAEGDLADELAGIRVTKVAVVAAPLPSRATQASCQRPQRSSGKSTVPPQARL